MRVVSWLLALVLPFQALTAVYLDMRGPLHFHVQADGHDHGRAHAYHDHGPTASHASASPTHAEHHHHGAHDRSVVKVRGDVAFLPAAVDEENRSGWSSVILVALAQNVASLSLRHAASAQVAAAQSALKDGFRGRLERPPRNIPV